MRKIVLCLTDGQLLGSLKKRLGELGVAEIIACGSVEELPAAVQGSRPEAAVVEYPGPELTPVAQKLWETLGLPMVVLAESGQVERVRSWGELVLAGILTKPVREEELMALLTLSIAQSHRVERLKEEISGLKESIETRKVVEKAKGRLMERDRLSEAEAFRRMQRLAMDRRISLRQLAEAILLTDSIGGGGMRQDKISG